MGEVSTTFEPFGEAFFEDPWETYRWMRDEMPVYQHPKLGFYAVSRYEDCVEVHRDSFTYTSTRGVTLDQLLSASVAGSTEEYGSINMLDPPRHGQLRNLVDRAFTAPRIRAWEPVVQRVVTGFMDSLSGSGQFDVMTDLASPFPVQVICEILGMPKADRHELRRWTTAILEREAGNPFLSECGSEAASNLQDYTVEFVAERRAHPGDGLVDHLIATEVPQADGTDRCLADLQIAQLVALLVMAGSETVSKLVGNGVITFAEHPDQRKMLAKSPTMLASAVEEVLRWRAPSQYQGRYAMADRQFHGITIPAGSPVLIITGAANRDPRVFRQPDRFDIARAGPTSLSFGHGIHYCIGAHLARLEARVTFAEIYRRWPNLQVQLDRIQYARMANVAGPSSIPVTI